MSGLASLLKQALEGPQEEVFCEETLVEEVLPQEDIGEEEVDKIVREVFETEVPEIIANTLAKLGYRTTVYYRKNDVRAPEYLVVAVKEDKTACLALDVEYDYYANKVTLLTVTRMDCRSLDAYMPDYKRVLASF